MSLHRGHRPYTTPRGMLTLERLRVVVGESAIFAVTGITQSALLPGIKLTGRHAETHSILMRARSRTIRYIRAVHDLGHKTIHLRSLHGDRKL